VSSEPPEGLRKELLDDFYSECDELLTVIRRNLTQMEDAGREGAVAPAVLEELFRGVHSLKGICAIAGVPPAEVLAQAVEDLLRGLTKKEIDYSAPMLDLLHAAAERLNKIIDAHRTGRALPDVAALLPRLAAYLLAVTAPGPGALPPPPPPPPSEAQASESIAPSEPSPSSAATK